MILIAHGTLGAKKNIGQATGNLLKLALAALKRDAKDLLLEINEEILFEEKFNPDFCRAVLREVAA